MPDAVRDFTHLNSWDGAQLQDRLNVLKSQAGDISTADTAIVEEIVAIMAAMRRKSSGPPKTTRKARGSSAEASIGDL